jgi:hypothetical protein
MPGGFSDVVRPDVTDAWVLRWPDAGIEIPWPEGMSAAEAIQWWKHVMDDATTALQGAPGIVRSPSQKPSEDA